MKILLALVLFAFLVFLFVAVSAKGAKDKSRAGAYRRRKLMTENELEFFGRLVAALPDHYIFPQVAMSALIEAASSDKKLAHGDRLRIAQQRVDYVVCTQAGELVAVVELDDRSHSGAKDQLRDSRLEQAGIRTVRFQSRSKPTPAAIRVTVCGPAPAADQVTPQVEAAIAPTAA
ncbi:DUF2726 domain-containing protein [Massilia suwonensis]|uniref:DUF2726 domain-containing protein n=1 Tax=Massilia suwonensis TaxID=648895 RepID=A0ABW0MJY4_9BURK